MGRRMNWDRVRVEILNDRFGTEFTETDRLFFEQVKEEAKADDEVRLKAKANNLDNSSIATRQKIADLTIDRMEQNQGIVAKYLDQRDFQDVAFPGVRQGHLRRPAEPPRS